MKEKELLKIITNYFNDKIFENHKKNVLANHSKLKSYKINPILVKYLSKVLENNFTPMGIAKALYYPRVLGTSINTSFGTRIQNMFVELGLADEIYANPKTDYTKELISAIPKGEVDDIKASLAKKKGSTTVA
jgi:hypothetical protein